MQVCEGKMIFDDILEIKMVEIRKMLKIQMVNIPSMEAEELWGMQMIIFAKRTR